MSNDPEADSPQNPNPTPDFHPPPSPGLDVTPVPGRPLSYWLKKFFACNPFYLVSAALLLYGLYLVSSDASFLSREASQLTFNFGSLQFYEVLLVATAIFLARRRIWYDSTLLVGLENLLILVPFILISQAALLNQRMVWMICLTGGIAALIRFWGLKHFLTELNLPRRALICGFVLLLINVALPLIFHHLHWSKVGTKPTDGAAYEMNRYCWLLLLPAMFALINLLPRAHQTGVLLPQRRWLPMGLFALWLAGSAVHLYSPSYVYNFDWEAPFYFPLLWVVTWSVFLRHDDFLEVPLLSKILLVPQLAVTLLALKCAGNATFVALTAGNIIAYAIVLARQRDNRIALHVLIISSVALLAGLVRFWVPAAAASHNGPNWFVIGAAAYLLYWVMRSRNPKFGLLGSLILLIAVPLSFDNDCIGHFAAQDAMIFLLLHSLRWDDLEHQGARLLRNFICGLWMLHAYLLLHSGWPLTLPMVYIAAGLLLAAWTVMKMLRGTWSPLAVPIAATIVLLTRPGDFVADHMQSAPTPLLVVAGSFLLFGLGTLAALTKSRWNPTATVAEIKHKSQML